MIGIALYPDKTTFKEDVAYLKRAQRYGYQKVFMSMLQIDIQDPKKSIRRLKESMAFANELGMLVMLDIKNETKKLLGDILKRYPYGETDGSSLGVACEDKSGALTCVLSLINAENERR